MVGNGSGDCRQLGREGEQRPFGQVFGHSQLCPWDRSGQVALDARLARICADGGMDVSVDSHARHVRLRYADTETSLWSIDPGRSIAGAATWSPLVLPRAERDEL